MHIPEGYLSPSTCLTATAIMLPIWYKAVKKLKTDLPTSNIPFLSMGAVFSFIIMMFNIPVPDGTTAHATGAVIAALALGPWAAVICISVALFIQAFVFGDGGILAFGANAFNIAFLMPFIGYYTYKFIAKNAPIGSFKQMSAAFLAGFVGLNIAALSTAIMFGIQPLLFTTADNIPLYCPYGLSVAIPAMMFAHILVAGPIEGILTAFSLKHILNSSPKLSSIMNHKEKISNV